MIKYNKRPALILTGVVVVGLIAAKFLFGLLFFIIKWAILLGIVAAIIYFVYNLIRENFSKPKRGLK